MRILLRRLLVSLAAATAVYALWLRPRLGRWGATDAELMRSLPGDEIVPDAKYVSTRAVTIDAGPADVWPWLVQMGQGRGGLYSYDWLENLLGLEIHSADAIVPALQTLHVGDKIRLMPPSDEIDLALEVAMLEPHHALVLRTPGDPATNMQAGFPYASWAFVLEAQGGVTRLIARWRADYRPDFVSTLTNHIGLEPVHFVMERKMLLGIKERAERGGTAVSTAAA